METEIIKFFQSYKSEFFDVFFGTFSYLASFVGFIFLFFLFFYNNKKYSIYFLINYLIIMLINTTLKSVINRPRPYEIDSEIISIITASGKSFPSGHMTSATILVAFLIYFIFKKIKNKSTKVLSLILGIIFIFNVAISRTYLGQHFVSDIIAGVFLGLVLSVISLFVYDKFILKKITSKANKTKKID